jgi:hypothetical protein
MSVTNPVAGFALGILAFDAPAPRDPTVLSAIVVSGLLIAMGIVGLANASGTQHRYGVDTATGRPRSESRYASSHCPVTAVSAPPGGTGGSTQARTDANRL